MQENQKIDKSKIKLLFITYTNSNGGGAEKLLTNYINKLILNDYKISVCEISHFNTKKEPLSNNIQILKPLLFHNGHYLYNFFFGFFNLKMLEKDPSVLKSAFHWNNQDIIITWNYQRPSFALRAFPNEGKIGWFHGDIYDLTINEKSTKEMIKQNKMQQDCWNLTDYLVTISKNSKKSLEKLFPNLAPKCEIINNGVDLDFIIKMANEKIDFQFDPDIKYICCVGRLDYNKNFILAIKAIQIVINEYKNCRLLIIGEGEQEEELKKYVSENNLQEYVIFLGYQNNPYKFMNKCQFLCVTSFSEGWSLVTAEMMVLGKTFITTKVAGASEELALNNTCGLISEWNEIDYAEKILILLKDENKYKTLCINSSKNVKQYTTSESVKKFEEIILCTYNKINKNLKEAKTSNIKYIVYNTFYPALQTDWIKKRKFGNLLKRPIILIYSFIYYFFWIINLPIRFILSIIYCCL